MYSEFVIRRRTGGRSRRASVPARLGDVVWGHLPAQVEPAPREGGGTTYRAANATALSSFMRNEPNFDEGGNGDKLLFWLGLGVSRSMGGRKRRTQSKPIPRPGTAAISNLKFQIGQARGPAPTGGLAEGGALGYNAGSFGLLEI